MESQSNGTKKKIIRITTVPISMNKILVGQLRYINLHYDVVGISRYVEKDFNDIKQREGIRMIAVPFARTISFGKDIVCLFKLIRIFLKERPQIVHSHTPKAGLLGMIAAKITNVPVRLHTVGGMPLSEASGTKLQILKFTEKLTYSLAHRIYPNSVGLKDFIIQNKFTSIDKLKVIANGSSNGVDANFYQRNYPDWETESEKLKRDLGINEGDFIFLFLGRIAREKGFKELLAAFQDLSKEEESVKLLVVGTLETENGAISDEELATIRSSAKIIFPGRTDNVRAFLRLADCFVFPTYREGFPNALLQAGAMGLPIIATDINGCNEIVEDGVSGYLIPPKDEKALFFAMENMVADGAVREKFSANIRETIQSKFKQDVVWNGILHEYDSFTRQTADNIKSE